MALNFSSPGHTYATTAPSPLVRGVEGSWSRQDFANPEAFANFIISKTHSAGHDYR